jgi:hypothetical protein
MLRVNLFVNPRYNHYCFGDYYDAAYQRAGIYPWFKCQTVHTWYDPLFVYDRWQFGRTDRDWAQHQAQEFAKRQRDHDLRPARTYAELKVQINRLPAAKRPEFPLAESVRTYATLQSTAVKFERISTSEREQLSSAAHEVTSFRNQRARWESPNRPAATNPRSGPPSASRPETRVEVPTPPAHPTPAPADRSASRVSKDATYRPAPAVHVNKPEREAVSNPPIFPKPSESRYIAKSSPPVPASEHSSKPLSPNTTGHSPGSR